MSKGYLFLAIVSGSGFVASVGCHVLGWLQLDPPWGKSVFMLHLGIFVVWIPFVIFTNSTMPKQADSNIEHLLAELPRWVRFVAGGMFVYTLINFAYFIYLTSQYPKNGVPFFIELRGFSGHWMLFYGVATAGFVALGRLSRRKTESNVG